MICSLLIFILLKFFADDVHCLVQAGLYCSFGNADNLCHLGDSQFLLIMHGEDLMQGRRQFGEHPFEGLIKLSGIHFHFYLLVGDGFGIEGSQHLCFVGIAAVMVLADVVGDGEEPSADVESQVLTLLPSR